MGFFKQTTVFFKRSFFFTSFHFFGLLHESVVAIFVAVELKNQLLIILMVFHLH